MPWRAHEIVLMVLCAALIGWLVYALTKPTTVAGNTGIPVVTITVPPPVPPPGVSPSSRVHN